MISRYTHHGLTWVDLENPTTIEISHLVEEFSIPTPVGEDMSNFSLRSKVDLYPNLIYLIMHFPIASKSNQENTEQEVDFIIAKDFIITVRYELIDSVHEFSKFFEVNTMLEREPMTVHGGYIFMQMMREFYKHALLELEDITKTIRAIEKAIFTNHETSVVKSISQTSRRLLDFKQALRFHKGILASYESASKRLFGTDYVYYAEVIVSEFNKVSSVLENHRDILSELQDTNNSLLSTKQNEILKTFTIMTFVMVPMTIITGVFGMNIANGGTLIRSMRDFYFVIGVMVLTGLVMFIYFKVRKWI